MYKSIESKLFGKEFLFYGFNEEISNIIENIKEIEECGNAALKAWFNELHSSSIDRIFVFNCACEELTKDKLEKIHSDYNLYGCEGVNNIFSLIEIVKNDKTLCGAQNENKILVNMKNIINNQTRLKLNSNYYAAVILHELTHMIEWIKDENSYLFCQYTNAPRLRIDLFNIECEDVKAYKDELCIYQTNREQEELTSMIELLVYLLLDKKDSVSKLTDGLQATLKGFGII